MDYGKDSFIISIVRVDVVKRVPDWASKFIKVGDEVFRTGDHSVRVASTGQNLALGKSYTSYKEHREWKWTDMPRGY